jgi:hypothetical protein
MRIMRDPLVIYMPVLLVTICIIMDHLIQIEMIMTVYGLNRHF